MSRVADFFQRASERLMPASGRTFWRGAGWALVVLVLFDVVLGCYWSREPEPFEVRQPEVRGADEPVDGEVLAHTLVRVTESLWDKPGGYLSNDILPHRLWLVRMPNWEQGVLTQVRDLARLLEERLGLPAGADEPDAHLMLARSQLHFDPHSWAMPNSRREFQRGATALQRWLKRLREEDADEPAHFRNEPEALDAWLAEVEHRLNELSLRLSQSVGRPVAHAEMNMTGSDDQAVRTPRTRVGAVFYEARGSAWALLHLLRAMEIEFSDVLYDHRSEVPVRRAINELEATQDPVRSPIILNSSGFGMLANHSLVMANYISRAQAAIVELRIALERG